jgi:nucleoside-diphosphate-sugar epimerase
MKLFLTGATGYIGGSVAAKLLSAGHQVVGLVRSQAKAATLQEFGIEPLIGSLADQELLIEAARNADGVINAADSDNRSVVATILSVLEGTGKPFIQTSGSSIVGDKAGGEPSDRIFDEDTPLLPVPEKVSRVAIDQMVIGAAQRGVRSIVLCNSLIYGQGLGLKPDSIQVPLLINQAKKSGIARYIGRGLNIWSTVHISDVADLYLLALERARAGSFFFVENGEAKFKDIVEAISQKLGLGGKPQSWSIEEAIAEWGFEPAVFALGSNSRVRATKARKLLGWNPKEPALLDGVKQELVSPGAKWLKTLV